MALAAIDLAPGAKIYLFYDEAFTDTTGSPGDDVAAEASELLQSIESFGFDVTTFVGTDAEWVTAAQNAHVIAIPDINAPFTLSPAAAFALKQFVDGGGTLIVLGNVTTNHTTDLVNSLFARSFVEKDFVLQTSTKTAEVVGTFGTGPANAGDSDGNTYTSAWTAASLGDAVSLYEDPAGDSTVAAFQHGQGQIVWLGWNWENAKPVLGQQDNGWLSVLNRAISHADGPSGNVINGTKKNDKVGFDLVAKKFNSTDRDDIIDLKKGDDKAEAGAGHDTIVGGKGDDKLDGQDGDDTIIGCYGNDKLIGGAGRDYFQFEAKPGNANLDKVKDYVDGTDKFVLASAAYKKLTPGAMSAQDFADHISYTGKGVLKYEGKAFAKIGQGHNIDETDFFVV